MLESTFFSSNRRELARRVNGELTILTANSLMQRTGDTVYPFRQDSNFFYLTGIKEPDLILVINGEEQFLVLPKRSFAESIFGGDLNRDEIAKHSGIKTIYQHNEGWQRIKELQQSCKIIHTITPPPKRIVVTDSFSTNPNRRYLLEKLRRFNSKLEFKDLRAELSQMRTIKHPEELKAIKEAINITAQGLAGAKRLIESGIHGYKLKAELDYSFAKNNSEHGFTPIITSGPDTAIMHSLNYKKVVKKGETVLFDIGAEVDCYSADISRTYFCGKPTQRQMDVHQAVLGVKQKAESLVKPGVKWRNWQQKTDEIMGEELIKLGLIKKNDCKNVRKYFSHAIGHSLGLDVHDGADYTKPIQAGAVLTVEPGIYIPEEGFGVRVEDDYLVKDDGLENLSSDA